MLRRRGTTIDPCDVVSARFTTLRPIYICKRMTYNIDLIEVHKSYLQRLANKHKLQREQVQWQFLHWLCQPPNATGYFHPDFANECLHRARSVVQNYIIFCAVTESIDKNIQTCQLHSQVPHDVRKMHGEEYSLFKTVISMESIASLCIQLTKPVGFIWICSILQQNKDYFLAPFTRGHGSQM